MRERFRSCSGQSLAEFALLFPLIFLLIVNAVNFGGLLYAYITVADAARSGASYMIMGGSSINAPELPSTAAITNVVKADLAALPHSTDATTTVNVCGSFTTSTGTTNQWLNYDANGNVSFTACTLPSNPPTNSTYADPQASSYTLGTVQVRYVYCPFIPGWNFPGLNIYTTLPSCTTDANSNISGGGTTITRVGAMRVMN